MKRAYTFCLVILFLTNILSWATESIDYRFTVGALYVAMHVIHVSCATCITRVSIGLVYTELSHALSI